MKKLFIAILSVCSAMMMQAAVSKTVNLTTAGTLNSVLTADERTTVTDLTITGTIDARDFVTMQDSMKVLANIDMSTAKVVAYTGTEGTHGIFGTGVYEANVLPSNAFSENLTSVIIPNSVKSIGKYAFNYCRSLTSVTIPTSVTSIEKGTFSDCNSLTSVTIPKSVKSIGDFAFYSCNSLISINLPDSVTSIGDWAFYNCSGITSVTVPSSLASIGNNAFSNCSGLTSVTIPKSVKSIGDFAFANCSGLTSLKVSNTALLSISNQVFASVPKTIPLYVPLGSKTIYQAAEGWKEFTNIIGYDAGLQVSTVNIDLDDTPKASVVIYTSGNWSATTIDSWISISPASGIGVGEITITAEPTTIGGTRTGSITITCGTESKVISITQTSPTISLGATNVTLTGENGATSSVAISSSADWTATSSQSWLHVTKNYENIVITADANTTSASRTATIQIAAQSTVKTITVTQIKSFIVLSTNTISLSEAKGKTVRVGVLASSTEWKASTDQTWIHLTQKADSLVVVIDTNKTFFSRLAIIKLAVDDTAKTITVTQYRVPIAKNIKLTTAGTLSTSLTADEKAMITDITITGEIDSLDFVTLRMMSRDNALRSIDLSGANIVARDNSPANKVPNAAFNFSTTLRSIILPNSVTAIGRGTFADCSSLTSITMPSSVTIIDYSAFSYCTNLTTIAIPSSVTEISYSAFLFCNKLSSIYVHSPKPIYLSTSAFYYVPKTIPLYVPLGSKAAYKAAEGWSEFTNIIEYSSELQVSTKTINLAESTTANISVITSSNWTASSTDSWISISPASGTGIGEITIIAQPNTTGAVRTATLTIVSDAALKAEQSVTITITQAAVTTDTPETSASSIVVYPNPTSSYFTVNTSTPATVEVYTQAGALLVSTTATSKDQIMLDAFAAGTYIVKVTTPTGVTEHTLIKQ